MSHKNTEKCPLLCYDYEAIVYLRFIGINYSSYHYLCGEY